MASSVSNGCWKGVSLPGAILADELQRQLLPEVLDDYLAGAVSDWAKVSHQSEGIYNAAVEHKPKDVFIKLPRLHPHTIVSPELITFVHAPHELVVRNNTWGAWHCFALTILLPPPHCGGTCRLAVGGHYSHLLLILPAGGYEVPLLPEDGFSSLEGAYYENDSSY